MKESQQQINYATLMIILCACEYRGNFLKLTHRNKTNRKVKLNAPYLYGQVDDVEIVQVLEGGHELLHVVGSQRL